MVRTIIERFDLYLLILCVATGIMVAYFDAKKFKNENKQTAYKQARYFGVGIAVIAIALYIVRFMFV